MSKGKEKEPQTQPAVPAQVVSEVAQVAPEKIKVRGRSLHGKTRIQCGIWFGPNFTEHEVTLEQLVELEKDSVYLQVEYPGKVRKVAHEPTQMEKADHDKEVAALQERIREQHVGHMRRSADEKEKFDLVLDQVHRDYGKQISDLKNELARLGADVTSHQSKRVFPPEMDAPEKNSKKAPKDK